MSCNENDYNEAGCIMARSLNSGALDVEIEQFHESDSGHHSVSVLIQAHDNVPCAHHHLPQDLLGGVLGVEETIFGDSRVILLGLHV